LIYFRFFLQPQPRLARPPSITNGHVIEGRSESIERGLAWHQDRVLNVEAGPWLVFVVEIKVWVFGTNPASAEPADATVSEGRFDPNVGG